nr:hypothetical protein [Pseudomonas sp.]
MQYLGLAVVIGLVGLIILWAALRMLFGGNWLLGWLRGTIGLLVLASAGIVGLAAWDLYSYRPLPIAGPIATLSFEAEGDQRYQVRIEQGSMLRYATLEGDLWQLDARVLRWKGVATLIGLEPGYRLQQLTARFLAVEQQDQARYAQAALAQSPFKMDFWSGVQSCDCTSLVLEAQPQRVTFMPIADGAAYRIEMTPTGLLASPANAAAEEALKSW